jgi:hypothetical protein
LPPENAAIAIPFSDRRDKIGALARSIGIFQTAMRKNVELNRTVLNDADLRSQRQQDMANEISHFSSEVEATLAELGRISDEILSASTQLGSAADNASAIDSARRGVIIGSSRERARHRIGCGRIVGISQRNRSPGRADAECCLSFWPRDVLQR